MPQPYRAPYRRAQEYPQAEADPAKRPAPQTRRTAGHTATAFPREVPAGVTFYVRLGLVERADPDQFEAIADRVAVFRMG